MRSMTKLQTAIAAERIRRAHADGAPQARDEKGQFSAQGAAARASAKEALAHAQTMRSIAAKSGKPEHKEQAAAADRTAKAARASARGAERATSKAEADLHAATAGAHADKNLNRVAAHLESTAPSGTDKLKAAVAAEKKATINSTLPAATAAQKEKLVSTGQSIVNKAREEFPGRAAQAEQQAREKKEAEKVHRQFVDDYEHSGDTERDADELRHLGAINIHSHDGEDEDGERRGWNTFQLPRGVSRDQFNAVQQASYHAGESYHSHGATGEEAKAHGEAKQHFESARAAVRGGRGAEAAEHAAKSEAAHGKAMSIKHTPAANAASQEAFGQSERARNVGTAAAHTSAARAHHEAASAFSVAGDKAQATIHHEIAREHERNARSPTPPAPRSAMEQFAREMDNPRKRK